MYPYDTVIFDLDGTLLNTLQDLADSTNYALALQGMPARTLEEVRRFVGNGVGRLIHRAVPEGTPEEVEARVLADFRAHYTLNMEHKTAPYPGVLPLLDRLGQAGIRTAVVSNKFDSAVKGLCHAYFGARIPVAIGESQGVARKPAPDTVFRALEELGAGTGRAVYVGDSDVDIQTAAKVCVVGKTVVDNLFTGGENPVGKVIRFQKLPFRIVGVLESKGYNSMGMDQDDLILAPYTTIQKKVLAITHLQGITCSALKEEYTDQAIDEITEILRRNHKLKESDDDDFTIRSQQELSTMLTSTTDMMTVLLAAVAGISLLVGGIGIMNIMYVSVTERTREIGLRMSIGAKGIDILAQFLIESILISVTGGLIGVVLGVGAALVVNAVAHFPIYIQPWSVVLSFAVCTVTGVFFGWYPAKKAAQLDPIEAIRYE